MPSKSNLTLAREKLEFLQRELVLRADPSVKFQLRHEITELEAEISRLERSSRSEMRGERHETLRGESLKRHTGSATGSPANSLFRSSPPWWLLSMGIALAVLGLAWWITGMLKLSAVIGIAAGALMLLRNPDYLFARIAFIAAGLLVAINTFNPEGFWEGQIGESRFRIEWTEPGAVVSIGLVVVILAAMYFHANRQ